MSIIKKYMRKTILTLAWPVFLEMCGTMLTGVLTTAMVGQYGAVSLAAVGLATLVQVAAVMIFAALGTGSAAIVARETGAKNWEELRRITGQAVLVGVLIGIMLAILGWFGSHFVFAFINTEKEVAILAEDLVRIMFIATPLYLIFAISNAVLRGMGRTPMALLITLTNNITAIVTSYILIFGVGVPAIGAYGAIWGFVIGQSLGGIMALAVLYHEPLIKLRWNDVFSYRIQIIRRILAISIPAALEQIALQTGRIAFTFMLASVGAKQFAAHQIALQVESISFLPGFSFAVAAMTLVGQNLGRGLSHRAIKYAKLTNQISFWGMVAMGAVFILFAKQLTALFIQDQEVVFWGAQCVMIAAIEQPTIALTLVYGGVLRGAGDTRWPMYITFIGVWLVRIPLIYLFIIVWRYPVTAAWYITAGDFLVRSVIMWCRFKSNKWSNSIA